MIDIKIIIDSEEFCHQARKVRLRSHSWNRRIIACSVLVRAVWIEYLLVADNELIVMGESVDLGEVVKLQRLVASCGIELDYEAGDTNEQ